MNAISRQDAINYTLAGRLDTNHTFRDLRSASYARKRMRTKLDKYNSWKGVNPGQLGAPHHKPSKYDNLFFHSTLPGHSLLPLETEVISLSKRELYVDAQGYPRPPKRHRAASAKCFWSPEWHKWKKDAKTFDQDEAQNYDDDLLCTCRQCHAER